MSDPTEDLKFLIRRDVERGSFSGWSNRRLLECARTVGIHEKSPIVARVRLRMWADEPRSNYYYGSEDEDE